MGVSGRERQRGREREREREIKINKQNPIRPKMVNQSKTRKKR